jgi:hypothetical protein
VTYFVVGKAVAERPLFAHYAVLETFKVECMLVATLPDHIVPVWEKLLADAANARRGRQGIHKIFCSDAREQGVRVKLVLVHLNV